MKRDFYSFISKGRNRCKLYLKSMSVCECLENLQIRPHLFLLYQKAKDKIWVPSALKCA